MNLSAQMFAEIVAALRKPQNGGGGGAGGGSEKRRATRMAMEAVVTVTALSSSNGSRKLRALIRDLSHNGAGLLLNLPMQRGDRLVIEFTRGQQRPPLRVLADIKSSRELADGIYSIGAEFVQEVTEGDDRALAPANNDVQRIQRSILC